MCILKKLKIASFDKKNLQVMVKKWIHDNICFIVEEVNVYRVCKFLGKA